MRKIFRNIVLIMAVILIISIILVQGKQTEVQATSYPLIIIEPETKDMSVYRGDIAELKFKVLSGGFKYEKYIVNIYRGENTYEQNLVGNSSGYSQIGSYAGTVPITITWDTSSCEAGVYTIEAYEEIYTLGSYRETPYSRKTCKIYVQNKSYSISYNVDDDIDTDNFVTSYVAGEETVLPVPEKSGYWFCGWYTNPDCVNGLLFNQVVITEEYSGDLELYTKWKKINVGTTQIVKLSKVSNGKVKIKLKKATATKVEGHSRLQGYYIKYSTDPSMKNATKKFFGSNAVTISGLKKGKKYFFQACALGYTNATSKNCDVYGKWSKIKSISL